MADCFVADGDAAGAFFAGAGAAGAPGRPKKRLTDQFGFENARFGAVLASGTTGSRGGSTLRAGLAVGRG
ncbi:hypothetical protein ACFROC_13465, partial [Nocardia tengchongensis]|uniref:hypothetical protein n=1 Tax=Nocardia tengchongensis TaxID=2055889 RepID=UPI00369ECDBE